MKFTIIGKGFILPRHIEGIKSINGEIVQILGEEQGKDKWREVIGDPKSDCVVILTPNDLHFEMSNTAAKCGKIVLCEKPLVLKSADAKALAQCKNIFTVLQLRRHPFIKQIKKEISVCKKNDIEMDISVFRDEEYYKCWKGKKERSGGVLLNLGIHYFDLLLYLFGDAKKVKTAFIDEKTGEGFIDGANYTCKWRVSTNAKKDEQRRIFNVNGKTYNFSSKDNLSFENLHELVYKDLLKGEGVSPAEEVKSIELIENLYASR